MVRDFYPDRPGSNPTTGGKYFHLCFIPLLRLSCSPNRTIFSRKWLRVIINDDFLEKGECYDCALLPSIICLGRLRIASKYIFNLWQLRQGVDFLAQWLEHWIFVRTDRVRIPRQAGIFFICASFLCYGFHAVRVWNYQLLLAFSYLLAKKFSRSAELSTKKFYYPGAWSECFAGHKCDKIHFFALRLIRLFLSYIGTYVLILNEWTRLLLVILLLKFEHVHSSTRASDVSKTVVRATNNVDPDQMQRSTASDLELCWCLVKVFRINEVVLKM